MLSFYECGIFEIIPYFSRINPVDKVGVHSIFLDIFSLLKKATKAVSNTFESDDTVVYFVVYGVVHTYKTLHQKEIANVIRPQFDLQPYNKHYVCVN